MSQRHQHEIDLLVRADEIATREAAPCADEIGLGDMPPASNWTDKQALALGFKILAFEATRPYDPTRNRCGWCVAAAGDTQEAYLAAPILEDIQGHTLQCEHNPLVLKLAAVEEAYRGLRDVMTTESTTVLAFTVGVTIRRLEVALGKDKASGT